MEKLCEFNDPGSEKSRKEQIWDPITVQTKGKTVGKKHPPYKVRKCGYCRLQGHTKVTCPNLKIGMSSSGLENNCYDIDEEMTSNAYTNCTFDKVSFKNPNMS